MSQPTEYERQFDFVDYETDNPTQPKPGVQLEAELNAVKTTTDEIRTNLALIQRDDGQLKNLSVTVDTLAPSVRALFTVINVRGAWVTATAYAVGDVVGDSGKGYICAIAHTSGVLATDVTASKWIDMGGSASGISFTPAGTIAATTVQDAIVEVAAEKQPLDTDLTAIAALTSAANKMPYSTGAGTWALADLTAAGRALLDDASAAAQLTTIGAATLVSNTFTGVQNFGAAINEKKGADIASSSTINLDTATGNLVDVTGTTTITAITLSEGRERTVRFTGALTLTHGASSIILPGSADITTAAGDFAIFRGYAAGAVRCVAYTKFSDVPGARGRLLRTTMYTSSTSWTKLADVGFVEVEVVGAGGGSGGSGTTANRAGGSGAGGGWAIKTILAASLLSSETVTIGAGGTAGTGSGNGGTGGTTSFGSHVSATGGAGGIEGSTAVSAGPAGGAGSSGDLNIKGGGGSPTRLDPESGAGGSSRYGGGAPGAATNGTGVAGGNYGGGASGAATTTTTAKAGAAGAPGLVIVREYS